MATISDLRNDRKHANVIAFLRAIRLGEGTADDRGYHRVVGGGEFESLCAHPRILVPIPRYNIKSTAAGAYQFIWPTWKGLLDQYHFPDFSEESQDLGAIALIREKDAIDDVKAGLISEAVRKCKNIWASLPGSDLGQRTEKMANVLAEYHKHGGDYVA